MTRPSSDPPSATPAGRELVHTLLDLARQVTSVLDFDELLAWLPEPVSRLIPYQALAVYLLDDKRGDLHVAHAVGYPPDATGAIRLRVGQGLVGTAVAEQRSILVNDVAQDARYVAIVPGMASELVVPLIHKTQTIGAINILSATRGQFTERDEAILLQFATHVSVALQNARLFERERRNAEAFETLAEIGRDMASILDLDELLTRQVQLARRVIDFRTFGIFLLNEATGELELEVAVKFGERVKLPRLTLGRGLVGHAALTKAPVLVPDVSKDPRYIKVVDDVRSELAVPMLVRDRLVGVFDLESPELDAFEKRHVEILTLLASQAAVAIQNARLYAEVTAIRARLEKEVRFAQRVQAALLPTAPPSGLRGIDVGARFASARELGGDFHDFLSPEPHLFVVALGDVSGKGVPAALYSAFAGELVRSRTFRRRFAPERSSPARVLASVNTILNERNLEEYYCTLCYAVFDLKRRVVTLANSGLPYPLRCSVDGCRPIEIGGVPLGSFPGSTYEELTYPLQAGDLFVFCSDGVLEATDATGREFAVERLCEVVAAAQQVAAQGVVEAIFEAVTAFRAGRPSEDDMTAVAVRITT